MVINNEGKETELRKYLETEVTESQHEIIRTNILNASRNYNNRVKAFIKEIVLDKSNPMAVKYYSTKVEFQGRGAAHNHGVLWVDVNRIELYLKNENGMCKNIEDIICDHQKSENGKNYIDKVKNEIRALILKKNILDIWRI